MENNAPVLFRERVHITQFFRTWLLIILLAWIWVVFPLIYFVDPLRNARQAALCMMFSSLWTLFCVMLICSWRNHILTEVHPDGIYIYPAFNPSGKAKYYRREDIQDFEVRRWHSVATFWYVWPFRNRAYLTNTETRNFGVRLTLQNRRKIFIETHRPSEFIFAIDQMMRQEYRPPAPHPFDRYPPE